VTVQETIERLKALAGESLVRTHQMVELSAELGDLEPGWLCNQLLELEILHGKLHDSLQDGARWKVTWTPRPGEEQAAEGGGPDEITAKQAFATIVETLHSKRGTVKLYVGRQIVDERSW